MTHPDRESVRAYIDRSRFGWEQSHVTGMWDLIAYLQCTGYRVYAAEQRRDVIEGSAAPEVNDVVVWGQVKDTEAILAEMRRVCEPLAAIRDILGYRVLVGRESRLEDVAMRCGEMWETPVPGEASWWQEYPGAIHLSRVAPHGVVEIQVMTADVFRRAYGDAQSEAGRA